MKTRKTLAAAALSATLALGMAPAAAFAYDAEDTASGTGDAGSFATTNADRTQSAGDSEVYVLTEARNISATVPLKIKVVGPAEGGDLYGTPGNYGFVNNSAYPIRVVDVVAAEAGDNWALSTTDLAAGDAQKSDAAIGSLCLKLTPAGEGATTVILSDASQKPGKGWVIASRADEKTGTEKLFSVTGSISQINSVEKDATHAIDITYTVAATTSDDA